MDMSRPAIESPAEAAQMLAWLIDMGADEIVADVPQSRFAETQAVAPPPKRALSPALPLSAAPLPPRPVANVAETQGLAAACQSIAELHQVFASLQVPGLSKSAVKFCFLEGAEEARVLVLGDRPRKEEEQDGGVFAGKTAILLRNMLKAIGLALPSTPDADCVALANLVPWRPPGNREPTEVEVTMCRPFTLRLLELLKPQAILALGALPGKCLASAGPSVPKQRGRWHQVVAGVTEVPLLATFHPEELLRFPDRKRNTWADLQMFRARLDQP
jgi:uracil-DNA glycosylase